MVKGETRRRQALLRTLDVLRAGQNIDIARRSKLRMRIEAGNTGSFEYSAGNPMRFQQIEDFLLIIQHMLRSYSGGNRRATRFGERILRHAV